MKNKIIFKQYEIQKIIGQGGMGTVYLAKDIKNNILVAIKRVYTENKDRDSILREPKILRKVNHANIVKVYDIYETGDSIFFVMEYIEGESLKDGLRKEKFYSENEVIYWAAQLCEALSILHNTHPYPIIYRDMKPSNILIDKNDKVTLIDFGIAQELKKETQNEKVALTRGFCAPEQYVENRFDNRSDIYSLGVTIHHLLSGIPPSKNSFKIDPIRDSRPEISQEMEYIITKATMIDPSQRYQNVEDLKYDLLNIDKINTDLKNLVVEQIISYVGFFIMYILCFAMIFLGFSRLKDESYDYSIDLVTEGISNLQSQSYGLAYKNFEKAISLNEEYVDGYKGIYDYYYVTANFTMGINYIKPRVDSLNKIIGLEEINNIYLSKYYYKIDNKREALKYIESAYETNKDNEEIIFLMALCNLANGDIVNGEKYLDNLIKINYDEYKIDFLNAKIDIIKENYNNAINFYAKIIDNSKDKRLIIDAYIDMAKLYKSKVDIWSNGEELYFLTLEAAENSLDKDDKSIELKLLKGNSYKDKANETEGANRELYLNLSIDNFHAALNLGRNEIEMYVEIAYLYRDLARHKDDYKQYDLAIQTLEDAKTKYPDEFIPQYHLTTLDFEKEFFNKNEKERDFQKAFESFNKAKALAKTEMDFQWIIKLENYINENVVG